VKLWSVYDALCYVCGKQIKSATASYEELTRTGRGWRHDACPKAEVCPKPCAGRHYYDPCARKA